jgi:beta propeller repeat protein
MLVACTMLVALPATALAGHVLDRFTAPNPPLFDPSIDCYHTPRIFDPNVAVSVYNDVDGGWGSYTWTVGAVALAPWNTFDSAISFDFSGTLVAYQQSGIYVTDGSGSYPVRVGGGRCANPAIDGYRVVWQDDRNGNWDIYGADLDPVTLAVTNEFAVCAARGTQSKPDIANGWCVWQDKRSGRFDIYGKNLASGHVYRLCGNTRSQDSPRTDGDWVVWTDWRNSGFSADIYGKKLPAGRERRICHAREKQWEPVVSDGFVVWTDHRSRFRYHIDEPPQYSLRGYEISSRDAFMVRDLWGGEAHPDMSADTVVWVRADDMHMGQIVWGMLEGAHLQH